MNRIFSLITCIGLFGAGDGNAQLNCENSRIQYLSRLADSLLSNTFPEPDAIEGYIRLSNESCMFWKRLPQNLSETAIIIEIRRIGSDRLNNVRVQE